MGRTRARKGFKRHHNQRVSGQKRQGNAEFGMDGCLATAQMRIVKAGQIIMHQGCAMQQFNRGCTGIGQRRRIVTTGLRHRNTQLWAHPRAARKHRIIDGLRKARCRILAVRTRGCGFQCRFNSGCVHDAHLTQAHRRYPLA
jgi:hypothetical protein